VRKDVAKAVDLRGRFVTDDDGFIAPRPDLLWPVRQAFELAGEVRAEVAHEAGHGLGVSNLDH
jgi:hypothetical protein